MLNEETVKQNAAKYFATLEKYGLPSDDMAKLLGVEFITAPASTSNEYFRGYEGGLVEHILSVTSFAVKINEALPESIKVDKTSLVKVCLLHQIGKAKMFVRKKNGSDYEFSKLNSLKPSEKSILYINELGIKLNEDEVLAIFYQDRGDYDRTPTNLMGDIIKTANMFSIKEFKIKNA